MQVAEKLDWKGLRIKKGVRNRKIIMLDVIGHRIGKGKRMVFLMNNDCVLCEV
jgi:hypothetical protein